MNANLDGATIQQAAQAARAALPAGTGFMLMAFEPGPCGTRGKQLMLQIQQRQNAVTGRGGPNFAPKTLSQG